MWAWIVAWWRGPPVGERRIRLGHVRAEYRSNRVSTTKYTLTTCVPRFLYEQFSNFVYIFFLLLCLLQVLQPASENKLTTILPFGLILGMAAVKEFYEDLKRRWSDVKVNGSKVWACSNSQDWRRLNWADLRVGHVVKVTSKGMLPADLVVLSSSEPGGLVYIETANLDGESNLKLKQSIETTRMATTDPAVKEAVVNRDITIATEAPNYFLHEFNGSVIVNGVASSIALDINNFVPRGSRLRNTDFMYGLVVYAGRDTKAMFKQKRNPHKYSLVNQMTNYIMMIEFGFLLIISTLACCLHRLHRKDNVNGMSLVDEDSVWTTFVFYMMTYSSFVPISLLVTLEVIRSVQAWLIECDLQMYNQATDVKALARRSQLNEALGQIRVVMTDKTGTLSQNKMLFAGCSIGGKKYMAKPSQGCGTFADLRSIVASGEVGEVAGFLLTCALCHTVVPEKLKEPCPKMIYHAASPGVSYFKCFKYVSQRYVTDLVVDEDALVKFAAECGFEFAARTPSTLTINVFDLMCVLEFSSERKRMGVVLRDERGRLRLLVKGADSVIIPLLTSHTDINNMKAILGHLDEFGQKGYRTLCMAYKDIEESKFEAWLPGYLAALQCSREEREERLGKVSALIENDLILLGASAIEDKLQEGVPETLQKLLENNMRVWMLTGDKMETAVNVGHSCGLLTRTVTPVFLPNPESADYAQVLKETEMKVDKVTDMAQMALVVDNGVMKLVFDSDLSDLFSRLAIRFRVVICCRCTPQQKASAVRLMKKRSAGLILAIGDGANDVNMIQAAHVGVGINGREGSQASMAADYAIGQFSHLQRLLFVHGVLSFRRTVKTMFFCCYKASTHLFLYFCDYSGTILGDKWSNILFNVVFTSMSSGVLGAVDRPTSVDRMQQHTKYYRLSQQGTQLSITNHLLYMSRAFLHACALFFSLYGLFNIEPISPSGRTYSIATFGSLTFFALIALVNWCCLLDSNIIEMWGVMFYVLAIIAYTSFLIIYNYLYSWLHLVDAGLVGVVQELSENVLFYIWFVSYTMGVTVSHIVYRWVTRELIHETSETVIKDGYPRPGEKITTNDLQLFHPMSFVYDKILPNKRYQSSYAFSQDDGGALSQSEFVRAYDSTTPKVAGSEVKSPQSISESLRSSLSSNRKKSLDGMVTEGRASDTPTHAKENKTQQLSKQKKNGKKKKPGPH